MPYDTYICMNPLFLRWGRLGHIIIIIFLLGGKSLFLGADRGGEGDRKWVMILAVPFRGQNQRSGTCLKL